MRIISPQPEEISPKNDIDFFFKAENIEVSPGGNRLCVIVDNGKPLRHDDLRLPLTLKSLAEGGHTVRALIVKSDGHFLQNTEAFAMVHFFVKKQDFQNYANPQAPLLTVTLPSDGTVCADEENRLWLDFRIANISPSESSNYQVHYRINDAEDFILNLQPIYWQGLKPGHYDLQVELMDKNHHVVPGPFNIVNSSFELQAASQAFPVEPATEVNQSVAAPSPAHLD